MQFEIAGRASHVRREAVRSVRTSRRPLRRLWRALLPVLALGTLGTPAAGEEPLELPTLPGYSRAATRDLSNRGHVVGLAFGGEPGAPRQAVLWSRRWWKPHTVAPLPTLPGMDHSEAVAISRSGVPVGFSSLGSTARAVVWKKGPGGEWEAVELEPPPGFTDAFATGVNSRGMVVGWARNSGEIVGSDFVQRAVLWHPQRGGGYAPVELETPDGFQSTATGINEVGDVVGAAHRTEFEDGRAFLRSDILVWHRTFSRHRCGLRSPVVLTPVPGLPTNRAPAINLRGDVVAQAETRLDAVTITRPVLWKRHHWWKHHHWKMHGSAYGGPVELPVPEGFTDASATDINALGRVVGTAFARQGAGLLSSRAVVWSRGHGCGWTVEELEPTESGRFIFAVRLNDLGWVAGNDILAPAGGTGALLWKPSRKRRWWMRH
jgi:uncharacterized membrane protein